MTAVAEAAAVSAGATGVGRGLLFITFLTTFANLLARLLVDFAPVPRLTHLRGDPSVSVSGSTSGVGVSVL